MKDIKFEFGEDIKEYLHQEASKTITLTLDSKLSEYARQCEVLSKSLPPSGDDAGNYEKFTQDGIDFYVSKDNVNLENVHTIRLKTKDYVSDRADRELIVEFIKD